MRKILVTGSEGFIGKETVRLLNESGFGVYTLDIKGEGKNHLRADINSQESREYVIRIKPDVIVHLAAQVEVLSSVHDPFSDLTSNILGTVRMLEAGKLGGVKEFIFVGSGGAIYSSDNEMPVNEDGRILPVSPYGVSKLAAENYVRVLSELNDIGWTSLALSNCYGSIAAHPRGVIFEFFKKITSKESAIINGPEVTRDFIHVRDVANAIYIAIGKPTNSRLNISSNTEVTLGQLFEMISKLLESDVKPIFQPPREGDVLRSRLDNSKAKKILNWFPTITLDEGLRENISGENRV